VGGGGRHRVGDLHGCSSTESEKWDKSNKDIARVMEGGQIVPGEEMM